MKKIIHNCLFVTGIVAASVFSCSEEISTDERPDLVSATGEAASATNCPSSHPYAACGRCWTDQAQAQSGGCDEGDSGGGGSNGGGNGTCDMPDWDPMNTTCVQTVANGSGCLNSDGYFVSVRGIVSNPCNTREAILDIERNLGIDIDDNFIALSGYQGAVPPINPTITLSDAKIYFRALFGTAIGNEFGDLLDTNNDGILTRNEASQAKGADPRQLLNLPVASGLATDDVLAYIGMYLGDGALDKYAGDLGPEVMARMESFTRTWQPGRSATSSRYKAN